jgi:hypothetical protein
MALEQERWKTGVKHLPANHKKAVAVSQSEVPKKS